MLFKIKYFLPLVLVISCICLLVYGAVQQNFRQGANDPQIQIAEDLAAKLDAGAKPQSVISSDKVDVAASLSPFVIIFDANAKVATSNALLDNQTPMPPVGVFNSASSGIGHDIISLKKSSEAKLEGDKNEDRFTWQPKDDVRIAAVLIKYNNGYVLAGRSLREVEIREDNLSHQVAIAWIFTIVSTFAATLIFVPNKKKQRR